MVGSDLMWWAWLLGGFVVGLGVGLIIAVFAVRQTIKKTAIAQLSNLAAIMFVKEGCPPSFSPVIEEIIETKEIKLEKK